MDRVIQSCQRFVEEMITAKEGAPCHLKFRVLFPVVLQLWGEGFPEWRRRICWPMQMP